MVMLHKYHIISKKFAYLDKGARVSVVYFLQCGEGISVSNREARNDFCVQSLNNNAEGCQHSDAAVLKLGSAVPKYINQR